MNSFNDIKYFVILGIAVMFLLFTSFLFALIFSQKKKNKYLENLRKLKEEQQNQLIAAAIRSEESERHRIAETLHDEVGAILSSAKLHLLGIKAAGLDEKDKGMYDKGSTLLNNAIKRVRGISHNMHSKLLDSFGFNEALRDFLKEVSGGGALEIETNLDEKYNTKNPESDISLYRMVQELALARGNLKN
jgi:two-component system, NarL family, sensor kinase